MSWMILAAQTVENTPTYLGALPKIIIMTICCVLALLVISRSIKFPHVGPKMPLPFPSLFNDVSVAGFLAAMSAGHLLGVLAIFGMAPYLQ